MWHIALSFGTMVQIISPFTCFYCSLKFSYMYIVVFFLGDFVAFCLFYAELFCFVMCKWKSAGGNVACVYLQTIILWFHLPWPYLGFLPPCWLGGLAHFASSQSAWDVTAVGRTRFCRYSIRAVYHVTDESTWYDCDLKPHCDAHSDILLIIYLFFVICNFLSFSASCIAAARWFICCTSPHIYIILCYSGTCFVICFQNEFLWKYIAPVCMRRHSASCIAAARWFICCTSPHIYIILCYSE